MTELIINVDEILMTLLVFFCGITLYISLSRSVARKLINITINKYWGLGRLNRQRPIQQLVCLGFLTD